eukprot:360458-Chlamydomonas_euryale.AAC.2
MRAKVDESGANKLAPHYPRQPGGLLQLARPLLLLQSGIRLMAVHDAIYFLGDGLSRTGSNTPEKVPMLGGHCFGIPIQGFPEPADQVHQWQQGRYL